MLLLTISSDDLQSKVVILGLSQSGKTSIRQVVFEGFAPRSTALNPATVRINRKLFNLAGGNINIFDVGGQTAYLNEVFQQYQERTFSNIKAAIFVVDVSDAANVMRSKYYFDLTLKNVQDISTKARVFVFAHKMDVVPLNKREAIIQSIKEIFEIEKYDQAKIFGTSIFDDSIWNAMQHVLSYVYPRDAGKSSQIKTIAQTYDLNFIALSTSQGLILYSEPEVTSGINYNRLKNELTKAFFPGMVLDQASFSFGDDLVFMSEIEEDLVLTAVFSMEKSLQQSRDMFDEMSAQVASIFKKEKFIGIAKTKMKQTLTDYLKSKGVKNIAELDDKLDEQIVVKCDICGKQVQKTILDVVLENSENLERGIKVSSGFGAKTIEINLVHDCIEGIREVPIILDNNLDYRRYEKSRPI